MEDKMRALVLGVATLALSAGAALAQAPAWEVYPGSGYAPYGYGYVPYGYGYTSFGYGYAAPAPLYGYAAPAYGYPAPAPLYGYPAPAYGYAAPPYGPPTGAQPPVAGEAAGNPTAESIAIQTARHRGSMYMSARSGSTHKKGALKTGATNGGY